MSEAYDDLLQWVMDAAASRRKLLEENKEDAQRGEEDASRLDEHANADETRGDEGGTAFRPEERAKLPSIDGAMLKRELEGGVTPERLNEIISRRTLDLAQSNPEIMRGIQRRIEYDEQTRREAEARQRERIDRENRARASAGMRDLVPGGSFFGNIENRVIAAIQDDKSRHEELAGIRNELAANIQKWESSEEFQALGKDEQKRFAQWSVALLQSLSDAEQLRKDRPNDLSLWEESLRAGMRYIAEGESAVVGLVRMLTGDRVGRETAEGYAALMTDPEYAMSARAAQGWKEDGFNWNRFTVVVTSGTLSMAECIGGAYLGSLKGASVMAKASAAGKVTRGVKIAAGAWEMLGWALPMTVKTAGQSFNESMAYWQSRTDVSDSEKYWNSVKQAAADGIIEFASEEVSFFFELGASKLANRILKVRDPIERMTIKAFQNTFWGKLLKLANGRTATGINFALSSFIEEWGEEMVADFGHEWTKMHWRGRQASELGRALDSDAFDAWFAERSFENAVGVVSTLFTGFLHGFRQYQWESAQDWFSRPWDVLEDYNIHDRPTGMFTISAVQALLSGDDMRVNANLAWLQDQKTDDAAEGIRIIRHMQSQAKLFGPKGLMEDSRDPSRPPGIVDVIEFKDGERTGNGYLVTIGFGTDVSSACYAETGEQASFLQQMARSNATGILSPYIMEVPGYSDAYLVKRDNGGWAIYTSDGRFLYDNTDDKKAVDTEALLNGRPNMKALPRFSETLPIPAANIDSSQYNLENNGQQSTGAPLTLPGQQGQQNTGAPLTLPGQQGQQSTGAPASESGRQGQQSTGAPASAAGQQGQQGTGAPASASGQQGQQDTGAPASASGQQGQQGTGAPASASGQQGQQGTGAPASVSGQQGQQVTGAPASESGQQVTGDAAQEGTPSPALAPDASADQDTSGTRSGRPVQRPVEEAQREHDAATLEPVMRDIEAGRKLMREDFEREIAELEEKQNARGLTDAEKQTLEHYRELLEELNNPSTIEELEEEEEKKGEQKGQAIDESADSQGSPQMVVKEKLFRVRNRTFTEMEQLVEDFKKSLPDVPGRTFTLEKHGHDYWLLKYTDPAQNESAETKPAEESKPSEEEKPAEQPKPAEEKPAEQPRQNQGTIDANAILANTQKEIEADIAKLEEKQRSKGSLSKEDTRKLESLKRMLANSRQKSDNTPASDKPSNERKPAEQKSSEQKPARKSSQEPYSQDYKPGDEIHDAEGKVATVVVINEKPVRRDFSDRKSGVTGYWAVVEADATQVSRSVDGVLQNRPMDSTASRAAVADMVNSIRENPAQILEAPTIDHGATTVVAVDDGNNGRILKDEFGNHRDAALQQAYENEETAAKLKETVDNYLKEHGQKTSDELGIKHPKVVFIQDKGKTVGELQGEVQKGNHTATRQMSPSQNALSDSLLLEQHPELMRLYIPGGNLYGDNREFFLRFMELTDTQNAGMIDENGRPTQAAYERIARAMFAYFLRDEPVARRERMLKSVIDNAGKNNILSIVKGLMDNAATLARNDVENPEYSIGKEIINALDSYLEFKRHAAEYQDSIDNWFNQLSMFEDDSNATPELNDMEKDIARIFDKVKSAVGIRRFFSLYNDKVRQNTGESLFADVASQTKQEIIHGMVNAVLEPQGTASAAFIGSEDGEHAPRVESAREATQKEDARTQAEMVYDAARREKRGNIDNAVKVAKRLFPKYSFTVYDTQDEMSPEHAKQIPEGGVPECYIDTKNGHIYIIADNMPSDPKKIRQRIMSHEIVGHDGLKQLLGKRYESTLDFIFRDHRKDIVPVAEDYKYNLGTIAGRRMATEEWLAHIADIENPPTWFNRIVARFRETLRKLFNIHWSDNDIRALIASASKNLQKAQGASGIRFSISNLFTGSAADYDQPSLHYIGTGEGAQAYGWGLYASDNSGIASWYASKDAEWKYGRDTLSYKGETLHENFRLGQFTPLEESSIQRIFVNGGVTKAINNLQKYINEQQKKVDYYKEKGQERVAKSYLADMEIDQSILNYLKDHKKDFVFRKGDVTGHRNLYNQTWFTNRVKDGDANLLDWNDTVTDEQASMIASAYEQATAQKHNEAFDNSRYENVKRQILNLGTGRAIYTWLATGRLGGQKNASDFLFGAGIDGIRYPANGGTDGSHGWNYVSFSDTNMRVDEHIRWSLAVPQQEYDDVERQYRGTDQWMKAPNGKATNLDERQWVQVRTPSFKQWFGDWESDPANASKVVDENGEPLIVWHGSRWNPLAEEPGNAVFSDSERGTGSGDNGFFGQGHYFTFQRDANKTAYKEAQFYGPIVGGYFLNVRRPFLFNENLSSLDGMRTFDIDAGDAVRIVNLTEKFPNLIQGETVTGWKFDSNGDGIDTEISFSDFALEFRKILSDTHIKASEDPLAATLERFKEIHKFEDVDIPSLIRDVAQRPEFTTALKKSGFDGVLQSKEGDEVVAFRSSQIKSATDNIGTFDGENPDIRFSLAPVDYKPNQTYHDVTGKWLYKTMRLVDGHLEYPMAGTGVEVPIGVWLQADDNSVIDEKTGKRITPLEFGSKTVRKNGTIARRPGTAAPFPGFHAGTLPYMAHIGLGGTLEQKHFQNADYVWVQIDAPYDRTEEYAEKIGDKDPDKVMRGIIPDNGMYWRKTNPNMKGKWGVMGQMKIVKVLSDDAVDALLDKELPDRFRMGRQGGGRFNADTMSIDGQDLSNWNLEEEEAKINNADLLANEAIQAYFNSKGQNNTQDSNQLEFDFDYEQREETLSEGERRSQEDARRDAIDCLRRCNGTLLGLKITKDFKSHGIASLVGQRITSPSDLADAAQIFRNPHFETLRYVFVKNGEVVYANAVTSRMPGSSVIFTGDSPNQFLSELQNAYQQSEADGYYLLHNHPFGLISPSSADYHSTELVVKKLGNGFLGHVIIDHNQYGLIDRFGKRDALSFKPSSEINQYDPGKNPSQPHSLLGMRISSPNLLAKAMYDIQSANSIANGSVALFGTSPNLEIQLVATIPMSEVQELGIRRIEAMARQLGRISGSSFFMLANVDSNDSNNVAAAVRSGLLLDAVLSDGTSIRQNLGINNTPRDLGMRLKGKQAVTESTSDVNYSLTAEQPTPEDPESVETGKYADRTLIAIAQTPIENIRAMRLPLVLELARKLKGDVTAVDRIPYHGRALGVFRPLTRQIEVLRRLAMPQVLEHSIVVPQSDVAQQRKLWQDYWTNAGVPANEIEITEVPVGNDMMMSAIRHDRTLAEFRKVAGHEIGHLVDYNSGNTTSHGNVLGTVGGMLQRWLLNVIGETPSTQIDRAELKKMRKELRKQAEAYVNQYFPKPPSSDPSIENWRTDVSVKYQELFEEECDKNGWFRKAVVREEMVDLTRWWSGDFDPTTNYGMYRMKPTELFAETMSVLLNAPDELMKRSPETWRLIQNYQANKADFHKAWRQLMDLMNDEKAYANALLEIQRRGFDAGEVAALDAVKEKPTFSAKDGWDAFQRMFINKFADVAHASKRLVKNGQIVFEDTPLSAITAAQHASVQDYYMKMANRLTKPLMDMGMTEKDIGLYMQNKRIENDPSLNDTDRGILNPNGLTADDAKLALEELHRQLGDEKWNALEQWHRDFWQLRQDTIIQMMEDSGAYSKELLEHVRDNEWYSYRKIVSTLYGRNGASTGGMMGRIYGLKGTVSDAANPLAWTFENDLRIMAGILWNTARMKTVDMARQFFPTLIQRPTVSGEMKDGRIVFNDAPEGFSRMYVMRDGRIEQWDVANAFAEGFRNIVDEDIHNCMAVLSRISNWFRMGWTTYSPTFVVNNVVRDYLASYQNMTWENAPGLIAWTRYWARGMKEAFGAEFGGMSEVVEEMERLNMFQSAQQGHGDVIRKGTELERLMAKYDLSREEAKTLGEKAIAILKNPLKAVGRFMERVVSATERGAKVGGYLAMTERNPEMTLEEKRYHIVKHIGSPDFATRGTKTFVSNTLFIFSNAAAQGWSRTWESAKSNPRNYAARWMATSGLSTILTWGLESGVIILALKAMGFDDDDEIVKYTKWMKRMYGKITHYHRFNYMCLPIAETEDGQCVFIRMPYEENSRVPSMILKGLLEAAYSETPKSYGAATETTRAIGSLGTNMNPYIAMLGDATAFAMGWNVYDRHFGIPRVNQTQFDAGGWQRAKGVGSYMYRSYSPWSVGKWDPTNPNPNYLYDIIGTTFGFGALVRVTKAGEKEAERENKAIKKQQNAKTKLEDKKK